MRATISETNAFRPRTIWTRVGGRARAQDNEAPPTRDTRRPAASGRPNQCRLSRRAHSSSADEQANQLAVGATNKGQDL